MKHTTKKLLALILAVAMVLSNLGGLSAKAQAAGIDEVVATVSGSTVTIGNGYISREFSTAGNKLSTTEIVNKRTEDTTVFTPAEGSEEFVIRITKEGNTAAPAVPALDRTGWTATANSRQNASGASDGPASNLLDGDLSSIWHSNYGGGIGPQNFPYNVIITLNGSKTFSCFSYTPRQQGEDTNGNLKGYELWYATAEETLAADDSRWVKASEGSFKYEGVNPIYVNLDEEITATQVKLVGTSAKNGLQFGGGAEFNLHAEKAPVSVNNRSFAASDLELDGEPIVEDTSAVINDVQKTGKKVTFHFLPFEFKGVTYTISEIVVMYNGDHFMRKYMEISVPEDQKALATIDFIDLESMVVNASDAQWTIPTDAGNAGELGDYKAMLGQPIYIQGMFFGCEFPVADTQIEDGVGRLRYYTGKNFERFEADNQLTTDGKYVTWQTVAGAARSTEMQVIQADFFEYIYSIATPSDFRIQYNSWFDNMMRIDDENILESFIEIDQEMNKVEARPFDSYVVDDGWNNYNDTHVVDAVRAGTSLNQSGFWEFNTKFPNELYPSSELVQKFGSNFGVWVGPRGGYNFQSTLATILTKSGKGSGAGGSVDVADRVYVENFKEMAIDWQNRFNVNYWKWDGYANAGQYNHFPAADGVPGYANRHMTGGYQHMYHVTDLWEAWIDLFEAVRANAKENNIPKLWISLTCYVNPSPWYLQWANSVWLQCLADQRDASFGTTKMNKQITYRDATYYAYTQLHQFQFPLANIYNHDPVYGTEGTGMGMNTATDEEFQNYLYMLSTRGTAFWELYFSDSIMTEEKYEVTGEFLEWAEENFHMLRNAKMIGGKPDVTNLTDFATNQNAAEAYGFSCFDGTDGIISIRNPHSSANKTISITFDRTIGVAEDCGTLDYHLEHTYNLTAGTATTGEFTYGETYEFTLAPNEVRIFRVSDGGDTTAPVMERAFSDGDQVITVRFNEKVVGNTFTVSGATVESVDQSADDVTYRITLTEAPADKAELTVTADGITDIAGNDCEGSISMVYNKDNLVAADAAEAAKSLQTNYGFTVTADVASTSTGVLVAQGSEYELGINAEGKAYFTVQGATAVSDAAVNDGEEHTIIGVKENNGILKLYVDGTLAGSAYSEANRFYAVQAAAITVGELAVKAAVYDVALGYDELSAAIQGDTNKLEGITGQGSSVDDTEEAFDKSVANAFDGNASTFWATVPGGNLAEAYLIADLGGEHTISKVAYTKRYDSAAGYGCTGNLLDYIIEVSTDGETWTQVAAGNTVDGTTEITFDPVQAAYVRLTATRSYHWQNGTGGQPDNRNTVMTVAEFEIYEYQEPIDPNDPWGKSKWVKVAVDSETIYNAKEGNFEYAWDGDLNTIWHSNWQGAHDVLTGDNTISGTIDFTKAYKINQFSFTNRQDPTDFPGYITQASLYVKANADDEWTCVGEHVAFEATKEQKTFLFDEMNVRYVKFVAEKSSSMDRTNGAGQSQGWVCIAEFDIDYVPGPGPHVHSFGDWTVTTEPSCTEPGVETRTCECGESETREVAALGHTYTDDLDATCDRCGEERVVTGQITGITGVGSSVDTSEPAYDKSVGNAFDGDYSTFWATVEGGTLEEDFLIADLGGRFTINKVEYTKRHDSVAGYNCTGNLLDYIIEVSTDGEVWTQVAAGETVDGTTEITFDAVEATHVRLRATRSYHWQEGNGNKVMTVAELAVYQVVGHTHTEEVIPGVAPTCTETGLTEGVKCAECGEILVEQEIIEALGHDYEAVVTAPTCTTAGYTTYTCSRCGDTYTADETPATGHTFGEWTVTKEATCTEAGVEERTCECGETETRDVPALGHSFGEWTVTKEATCTEAGIETRTCECGETETREVPAKGHDYVNGKCACGAEKDASFSDVPVGDFYFDAVEWAVDEGITTGAFDDCFDPNGSLLRAQVVTMLWRHAGQPTPTVENPFEDVTEEDFFYDAVLWAYEEGITTGISDDQFGPYGTTNRAQVVTFLWRYLEEPTSTAANNFSDVVAGEWYEAPINWAVENGVTNGMGDGTFGINVNCNRAHMVTFLYRALALAE